MLHYFQVSLPRLATAALIVGLSTSGSPAIETTPEGVVSFDEMMASISAVGSVPNGDGHRWTFRQKSDGSWEVEGARRETAAVTESGTNTIKIDGFPSNWGANGRFEFKMKKPGKCELKSDHSGHRLKWNC